MTSNSDLAEHDETGGQEGKGAPTRDAPEPGGTLTEPPPGLIETLSQVHGMGCGNLATQALPPLSEAVRLRRAMLKALACLSETPLIMAAAPAVAARAIINRALASVKPTAGPPAAPSPEWKDPGEPQSPSVSAEERVLTGQSFQCPRAPADAGGHHRWIKAIAPGYDPITATTCGFCGVLLSEASAIDVLASLAEAERKESAAYAGGLGRAKELERALRAAAEVLETCAFQLHEEGENYRDGNTYQPHAKSLRSLAKKAESAATASRALAPSKP